MSDLVQVNASWALWGKYPGTNDDYSILASSSQPFGAADFARILAHFAPGTPPTEGGLPSSLPWVTISRVGASNQFYLGIAIQEMTSQVDGAGRPITRTCYFCLPYAELAKAPISYADLYRSVAALQLPHENGDLIRISVPPLDARALADDIMSEFSEAQVSTAAALLLSGPVSIVGSDGSAVVERLRFLDAVAAMLPYGYRTWYTAATWSDSGARHRIRLAFAARPREDAAVVRWRSAPEPGPVSGPAGLYLQQLRQLRHRDPSPAGLAALISFLAELGEPRRFEQPQYAIGAVRDFDRPFRVLDELRQGHVDRADIRQVFATSRITELPAADRETLLAQLISFGDPEDWPVVQQWWDCIASDNPAAMLPELVAACRRLLWTPAPGRAVREHLTLAANYGIADALLARILPPPTSRADLTGGLSCAAQLLADWVLAKPGADPGYPQAQAALTGNPLVACGLLVQVAESADATRAAIAWLDPVLGRLLHPFSAVLGDQPGVVDPRQLDELAGFDLTSVHMLLQAASYAQRLDRVLPAFTSWLTWRAVQAGVPAPAEARGWQDLIWALAPADLTSRAWLDLALLVSGNAPRSVLAAQGEPHSYNACFIAAWRGLVQEHGTAGDELITTALIHYLSQSHWTADEPRVAAVVDLMQQLEAAGKPPRLEAVVAGALSAAPGASNWEVARQWLGHMQQSRPRAVQDGTLFSVGHPPPGATSAQLAELCLQAFRNGLEPQHAADALAGSGAVASGKMAVAILRDLRHGLSTEMGEPERCAPWLDEMADLFAGGTFSPETTEQFRSQAISGSLTEIGYQLHVLHAAIATGGAAPELPGAAVLQLEEAQKAIDQLLRQVKKRAGWHRFLGPKPGAEKAGAEPDGEPETEAS